MKSNQSLHITVKEPPLTVASLGVFCNLPDEAVIPIISQFLKQEEPKDEEFISNVTNECIQILLRSTVLTASKDKDGIITIKMRENK